MLLASIVASATHPLLDWTNNYGIRFLLPWNPRWFYGDLVFIVDPFLWLVLGAAAFLLTSRTRPSQVVWAVVGLITTFLIVFGPRNRDLPGLTVMAVFWIAVLVVLVVLFSKGAAAKWGRSIAFVSFAIVVVYWCGLAFLHARAVARGNEAAQNIARPNSETVSQLAAMPTLANPLRWDCVFETDRATYRFQLDLREGGAPGRIIRYPKPSGEVAEALKQVSDQKPAQVFLGFARFPVARLADSGCATHTLVQLADLRYTEPGQSRGTFALELPVDCRQPNLVGGR